MSQIHRYTSQKEKYILDADIKGCFDNINHQELLSKIQTIPLIKHFIKGWLKMGVMNKEREFEPTKAGTPQGGVISPLLANIALHGMERDLKAAYSSKEGYPQMVRYADDFVIFHEKESGILKAKRVVEEWIKEIGLELKPNKIRFSHTSRRYEGNSRSPYDGDRAYWSKRLRNHPMLKTEQGILLKRWIRYQCGYRIDL